MTLLEYVDFACKTRALSRQTSDALLALVRFVRASDACQAGFVQALARGEDTPEARRPAMEALMNELEAARKALDEQIP